MKQYQKVLLGFFISIVLLLGGLQIYLSFFLDDQLKNTAVERFHEATDDAYDLEIGDLNLQLFGRQLSLSDIELTKKEEAAGTDIRVVLDGFEISGIGVFSFLFSQELHLDQILLTNPAVYITASGNGSNKETAKQWSRPSQQLSEMVLERFDNLTVSDFSIEGLSLDYNRSDLPVNSFLSFKNSDIRFYNISIDSTSLKDDRVIPSDEIALTFRNLRHQTANDLYNISIDRFEFSSSNNQANIESIALNPKFDKQEFAEKVGYEIDQITMSIDQISWNEIDSHRLNRTQEVTAPHIAISRPNIEIYRDKRQPPAPKNRPPLPQQMIRNIPFGIDIDSLTITNGNIRYSERHPEAEESGYIAFTDLSATLSHLTNNEKQWAEGNIPTLRTEAKIMDEARLQADFTFFMANNTNRQRIKGNLESMDMQPLNEALIPLAFVRIDDGEILGMEFDMNLNEQEAGGQVILRYENFSISLLDKGSNEENFGSQVKSLLANTFKIKSENKGDEPRIGKVGFERDQEKSTFNYWWKSLLSGLKASIGL